MVAALSADSQPHLEEHYPQTLPARPLANFFERFGQHSAGELEPKPGIDPSPGHVQKMIEVVKSQNVKAIIQEPFFNAKCRFRRIANRCESRSAAGKHRPPERR